MPTQRAINNYIKILGLTSDLTGLTKDEQIIYLLTILRDSGIGKCAGCGTFSYLVRHHWYNKYPPCIHEERMICQSCNNELHRTHMKENGFGRHLPRLPKTNNLNPSLVSHVLPPWEIQVAFLKHLSDIYQQELEQEEEDDEEW